MRPIDDTTDTFDLTGYDRAQVLCTLYNESLPLGLGILQYTPDDLGYEEASQILQQHPYIDYLKGRVMKVDFSSDILSTRLYDRDNGRGAAARVLLPLRPTKTDRTPV